VEVAIENKQVTRTILPLKLAVVKCRASPDHLTPIHPDFLQMCILAKNYKVYLFCYIDHRVIFIYIFLFGVGVVLFFWMTCINIPRLDFLRISFNLIFLGRSSYPRRRDFRDRASGHGTPAARPSSLLLLRRHDLHRSQGVPQSV
jgi:hypothetical protein